MSESAQLSEKPNTKGWAITAIPLVFVLIWSSGFIVAKIGLSYAEPFTLLLLRFVVSSIVIFIVILCLKLKIIMSAKTYLHLIVAGVLLQFTYFGGCWLAMNSGVSAGVLAIIVCMQPILVAVLAYFTQAERLLSRQYFGLALSFAGVILVVFEKIGANSLPGIGWSFVALIGITAGTLYQKRFCGDVKQLPALFVQCSACAVISLPFALFLESGQIEWSMNLAFAIFYLSIFISLITVGLLNFMIANEEVSRISSLFFLVPPCSGLMAYFILQEELSAVSVFGMAFSVVGVAMVMIRATRANSSEVEARP